MATVLVKVTAEDHMEDLATSLPSEAPCVADAIEALQQSAAEGQQPNALGYEAMEGSPCSPPSLEEQQPDLESGGPAPNFSDAKTTSVAPVQTTAATATVPAPSQRRSGWDVGPPSVPESQEAADTTRKQRSEGDSVTPSARDSGNDRESGPAVSEVGRKHGSTRSNEARISKSPRREKAKPSKRYSRSRSRSPKRVRKHSPRRRSRSPKRSRTRSKSRSRSPPRKRSYSPPLATVFPARDRRPAAPVPYWLTSARLQPGVREYFESLYERGVLRHDDLDAACVDYLKILPSHGAMQVLQEFARLDYYRIRNLTAFFIGICRRVAAHEPPPPGRGIPAAVRGRDASPPPPFRAFSRRSPSGRHTPESPEQQDHDMMGACSGAYSVAYQDHGILASNLLDPRLAAQSQDVMGMPCLEPAAEPCTPPSPPQPSVSTMTPSFLAAGGLQQKVPPHISASLKAGDPRAQLITPAGDIYSAEHLFSRSETPYVTSSSAGAAVSHVSRDVSVAVADLSSVQQVDWGHPLLSNSGSSLSNLASSIVHSSHSRVAPVDVRLLDPRLAQTMPPPPLSSNPSNGGYSQYKGYSMSHVGSIPVQPVGTSSQLAASIPAVNGLHGLNGSNMPSSGSFGFHVQDLIDRDHLAKLHCNSVPNGGYPDQGSYCESVTGEIPPGAYSMLRQAVTEYVKEIMKPAWKAQKLSREAFKTIAKKAVDKVLTTQGTANFPDNADGVVAFMTELRKDKIRKLVQQYLEKYEVQA